MKKRLIFDIAMIAAFLILTVSKIISISGGHLSVILSLLALVLNGFFMGFYLMDVLDHKTVQIYKESYDILKEINEKYAETVKSLNKTLEMEKMYYERIHSNHERADHHDL